MSCISILWSVQSFDLSQIQQESLEAQNFCRYEGRGSKIATWVQHTVSRGHPLALGLPLVLHQSLARLSKPLQHLAL